MLIPFKAMLAVAFDKEVAVGVVSAGTLEERSEDRTDHSVLVVWPDELHMAQDQFIRHSLLFTSLDLDLSRFLERWFANGLKLPLIYAQLAETRPRALPLQLRAAQAVVSLETIQRALSSVGVDSKLRLKADRILASMHGLNSKDRRWLTHGLKRLGEPNLETRLVALVGELGREVAEWLLGPDLQNWAKVCARVRNVLQHGLTNDGDVASDVGTLVAVAVLAEAIARLYLLADAGSGTGPDVLKILEGRIEGGEIGVGASASGFRALREQRLTDWSQWA